MVILLKWAKILGDIEDRLQAGRQSLASPAGDGLVPPHRPLPPRQAVDVLELHDGPETFHVIHSPSPSRLAVYRKVIAKTTTTPEITSENADHKDNNS